MALRVLLADESSTIKKVMQLALQDFDVEVKAVPIGLDVLDVAKGFQPEIIFADVLLSKRNGYEVCAELKADRHLHKVPVVLMWSGFMEIDEKKAALSKPDRRLEKPFDAESLRNLVRELVPRLQTNVIAQFLSFPNLPEIEEDEKAKRYAEKKRSKEVSLAPPPMSEPDPSDPGIYIPSEEDEEEFQNVPLPKAIDKAPTTPPQSMDSGEDWAQQDLSQFKIPTEEVDLTQAYEMTSHDLSNSAIAISSGMEEISLEELDLSDKPMAKAAVHPTSKPSVKPSAASLPPASKAKPAPAQASLPSMTQLSHERVEQILREQVREVLESIAWKILPDMAERIVREEIQKLVKDAERL